ncbi:MAG TPA: hypothetical protein VM096_18315 [Vicinamibacterales bacterium]|nr:hypothetical protein [Vicinamibacterales bacterium]
MFQILPGAVPVTCPMCGVQISWRYAAGEFDCPSCGCGVTIKRRYFRSLYAVSLAMAVAVAYVIGLRDEALQAAAALLVLPTFIVITIINMRLFPPEVEVSGNVRGILHPAEPQDPSIPPDPIIFGDQSTDVDPVRSVSIVEAARRIFPFTGFPRTMEGRVIAFVFMLLFVFTVYQAVEPLVYQLWPEYKATKHGPRGFPVTLHIYEHALSITNQSSAQWRCLVVVGSRPRHNAFTEVAAGATVDVPFASFQTVGGQLASVGQRSLAARRLLYLECDERDSHVSRSFTFQ